MARYWSYLRYSRPEQGLGDSERRQEDQARQRAATLDMEYVDEYRDLGVPAFRGKNRTHGALARFLDDIKGRKVAPGDVIGVENVDRLSREGPRQAIKLLTEILDLGVLVDIRGQLVTDSFLEDKPYYWYELIGEMNRAHSESKHKSERLIETNKNKREKARAGNVLFAGERCPGWLIPSPDGSCYLIRDNRDKIVQQIFQWAAAGIGTPTIAIRLNKAEFPLSINATG